MKTIVEIPRGSGIWFTFDNSVIPKKLREKLIAAFQVEIKDFSEEKETEISNTDSRW